VRVAVVAQLAQVLAVEVGNRLVGHTERVQAVVEMELRRQREPALGREQESVVRDVRFVWRSHCTSPEVPQSVF